MYQLISKLKILLAFLIMMPFISFGQYPDDPGYDPDDPDVPIDGGVSLLIAAGIGYGAKKIYDKKKTF